MFFLMPAKKELSIMKNAVKRYNRGFIENLISYSLPSWRHFFKLTFGILALIPILLLLTL